MLRKVAKRCTSSNISKDVSTAYITAHNTNKLIPLKDNIHSFYKSDKETVIYCDMTKSTPSKSRSMGAKAIQQIKKIKDISIVKIEDVPNIQQFSEGLHLASFVYDDWKSKKDPKIDIQLVSNKFNKEFNQGKIFAQSQNLARKLMETPSNWMTPSLFVETAKTQLSSKENIIINVRDTIWAKNMKMNSFLAVGQGSSNPSYFLEIHYNGKKSDELDLAIVGKGVTFDSGGISIKPSAGMALMKGDMGGAAVTLATMCGVVDMKLPLNISAFIPLCENMPSGAAIKPGDVVEAMNGKTIEIDNTDAEGRLILADALTYASRDFKPKTIIDIATLTGAMDVSLGYGFTGAFSNSSETISKLIECGNKTGDPIWRMPLHKIYRKQLKSHVADLSNVGGRSAGSCTAAMFLREFVCFGGTRNDDSDPNEIINGELNWVHLDIAGVMHSKSNDEFGVSQMSGRPTRTLLQFCCDLK